MPRRRTLRLEDSWSTLLQLGLLRPVDSLHRHPARRTVHQVCCNPGPTSIGLLRHIPSRILQSHSPSMVSSQAASDPSVTESESRRNQNEPLGTVSTMLAILTIVLWGGTAVANQFAIDVYPSIFVGGVRFGMAAIFMVFWCLFEGSKIRLTRNQWKWPFIVGFLMFVQIGTFNFGTELSNSSHATVLVNSYIFWVAGIEAFVLRSARLHWWQILGLLLAGSGVCLLVATSGSEDLSKMDQPSLRGDLILALSGLSLGIKIILVKEATKHVAPGPLILWHNVVGTTFLFVASAMFETHSGNPITTEAVIALLYGGFAVSGFCFAINARLLQKHGASQISVFSFGTPICGIVLAHFLRGDHLSEWLLTAGLFVAMGILLVNYVAKRKDFEASR